ncbi:MAG: SLC13 family permease [Xanthomonadales bacterium]|nr:SLC13 family permease [Xanthomonadales bacterium]
MTTEQIQILSILGATIAVFLWGRWRHDLVAMAGLLACVFAGLVPAASAFSGFGHPAVITVGCVLILSSGLQDTGVVDVLTRRVLPTKAGPMLTIASIMGLGAVLSAFMNNVGAMALLMPVAIQISRRLNLPPGKVLMPLSFGTILGGMTTLIGTPPNLIVSGFREAAGMGSFSMFDFTPVGLAIAGGGIVFVALLGWKIVPAREQKGVDSFETGAYLTEARIVAGSRTEGKTLREIDDELAKSDAQIIGMVRNGFRITAPNTLRVLRIGDILIIEADPETLISSLSSLGLVLEEQQQTKEAEQAAEKDETGDDSTSPASKMASAKEQEPEDKAAADKAPKDKAPADKAPADKEVVLRELVIKPNSLLIGRSATDVQLRTRYNLNLLAISRQGQRSIKRLRTALFKPGDVLLMQGAPGSLLGFASASGCLPLAARDLSIPNQRKATAAVGIMALAIGAAAFGLMPAVIAFATGVLLFMLFGVIPLRRLYDAIDWPVIVLLGALIPVAVAMETTGTADLLARTLLDDVAQGRPIIALALILVVTMTLSDFMNNAATAAVMCPIAISTAQHLGVNVDTFLMAVAVGASCAFLTPIGHQNNTLILGPGGFRFSDYWKLGLPTEILIVAIGVPMLLVVWPL